jgi:hypothetical protein
MSELTVDLHYDKVVQWIVKRMVRNLSGKAKDEQNRRINDSSLNLT